MIEVTRRNSTSSSVARSPTPKGARLYLWKVVALALTPSIVVAGMAAIAPASASAANEAS